jgi:hypothetical protein
MLAVLPVFVITADHLQRIQMPRRYGRVKAKPPSAVRFAQP